MTTTDKVAIGCTLTIGASALTMLILSNKYLKMAEAVNGELRDIHSLVSKSREDIIEGNKAYAAGNEILKGIAQSALRDATEGKVQYKKPSILNMKEG